MFITRLKTLSVLLTATLLVGCTDNSSSPPPVMDMPETGSGVGGGAPMPAAAEEIPAVEPAASPEAVEAAKPEEKPADAPEEKVSTEAAAKEKDMKPEAKPTEAPKEAAPKEAAPKEAAPKEAAPKEEAPKKEEAAKKEVAPEKKDAPKAEAPEKKEAAAAAAKEKVMKPEAKPADAPKEEAPKKEEAAKKEVAPKKKDAPEEEAPEKKEAAAAAAKEKDMKPEAKPADAPKEEAPKKEAPEKEAPKKEEAAKKEEAPEKKDAPKEETAAVSKEAATAGKMTGDWSMWGGDPSRNMVNKSTEVDLSFTPAVDPAEGKNIQWTATLGSQTYGNPIVAEGKVFVGTNNGGEYREQHKGDRGIVLAFNEADGKFLWQLTREKLPQGRVNDWPEQGICSTPVIENGRMYVATNRCELMCIDIHGFHDGENNGPYTEEADNSEMDADIIWSLDMIEELGVFPHNLATSSPVIHGDLVMLVTSNGVDEAHLEVPSPRAPCFIAVNKNTGELVWEDNSPALDSKAPAPFDNILHGQWGSPALGEVDGKMQVFMPGGDGVLYSYDVATGELIWWFDLNPKDSTWELGGRGTRNAIISTPVFVENSVILAVGQDPEHGEGVGHLYRIDPTKKGDVSPKIAEGDGWKANPNSGEIWHVGGVDEDGTITGEKNGLLYRRTISTVAVADGLVYAPDLSGFLHCIDLKTGEKKWVFDTFAAVWGSPMVVDGRVLLGDEDGEMVILRAGPELEEIETKTFNSSIYSTPTIANGRMYVSDRSRLYAINVK